MHDNLTTQVLDRMMREKVTENARAIFVKVRRKELEAIAYKYMVMEHALWAVADPTITPDELLKKVRAARFFDPVKDDSLIPHPSHA